MQACVPEVPSSRLPESPRTLLLPHLDPRVPKAPREGRGERRGGAVLALLRG